MVGMLSTLVAGIPLWNEFLVKSARYIFDSGPKTIARGVEESNFGIYDEKQI